MSDQLTPSPAFAPAPAPAPAQGNGLATAGFVLALIGVVLCLVPIVNNAAFVLALLGLVFGIVGLVKARRGAPKKGLAIAAIVLAVVGGIGVLASQAFYGKVIDEVVDELDDSPTAAQTPADAAEPDDAEPAAEPASEPAAAEQGTRTNPFPAGTLVANDDWDITIGTPREAWGEIKAENQFNSPPEDGTEYWIVPLSGTYKGAETAAPWVDLSVQFVGDDSVTYDGSTCGVIPEDLTEVGELYTGGQFTANECVVVPAGAPGLFTLQVGWFSDPVFFAK